MEGTVRTAADLSLSEEEVGALAGLLGAGLAFLALGFGGGFSGGGEGQRTRGDTVANTVTYHFEQVMNRVHKGVVFFNKCSNQINVRLFFPMNLRLAFI